MQEPTFRLTLTRAALGASILLFAGCGLQMSSRADSMPAEASAPPPASYANDARPGLALESVRATRVREGVETMPRPQVVTPSAMVIRNGSVSIEVDSLEIAIDRVRALAQSLGGYLGNVAMQTGKHQVRGATLEMKIPAARFDSAMTGMPTLGKVEQSTATAEDVGEEFVDVSARVANSKRLESRLVDLLATRTGKLDDVLKVERELARVRQEIEQYEGRMRYLSTRVATSTIVANVHEKAPLIAAKPGPNVFVTAFLNMGRNFVGFLTATIEVLGVFVPVALIGWAALLVWKRWRRGRVVVTA